MVNCHGQKGNVADALGAGHVMTNYILLAFLTSYLPVWNGRRGESKTLSLVATTLAHYCWITR